MSRKTDFWMLESFNHLQVQAKLLENMISQNNELLLKVKERCSRDCECVGSVIGPGYIQNQLHSREIKEEAKEEAKRVFEAGRFIASLSSPSSVFA